MKSLSALFAGGLFLLANGTPAAVLGVAHYDVHAHIDPVSSRVSAQVVITLPVSQMGREISFSLGERFKLRSKQVTPAARITLEHTDTPIPHLNRILVRFAQSPRERVVLRFSYDGLINDDSGWKQVSPEVVNLQSLSWLPFQSDLALRFTADMTIIGLPSNLVLVTGGDLERSGDRLTVHQVNADTDTSIGGATALRLLRLPGVDLYARDLDSVQVGIYRNLIGPIESYYSGLFGPPPGAKRTHLLITPDAVGSAFERIGFISIPDTSEDLKLHPEIKDLEFRFASTLGHELAHTWWREADQQNYWLAESMATYSAFRFRQQRFGEHALESELDQMRSKAAKAGPVLTTKRPSTDALYEKGPVLLLDLEKSIGRPAMDRLLGILGRHPPHRTEEFIHALSEVAGTDVARAFEVQLRAD